MNERPYHRTPDGCGRYISDLLPADLKTMMIVAGFDPALGGVLYVPERLRCAGASWPEFVKFSPNLDRYAVMSHEPSAR